MADSACPTPDDLAAFNTGRLHEEAWHRIAEHLRFCELCQRVLAQLNANDPGIVKCEEQFTAEPECEQAVERISAIPQVLDELMPQKVGRYKILERLARGGMGSAFKAYDAELDRNCVIKLLHSSRSTNSSSIEQFSQEWKNLAKQAHPAIVMAFDAGSFEGGTYLAMEFVDGKTLRNLVSTSGPLPVVEVIKLGLELLSALDSIHKARLTHGDITPSNLMLTAVTRQLKLLDFGLSTNSSAADRPLVGGTLAYMAPEQTLGPSVDKLTDYYALGATLYFLLTARNPIDLSYTSDRRGQCELIRTIEPLNLVSIRHGLPKVLVRCVHELLRKNPDSRPQSTHDIRRQLEKAQRQCAARMEPARTVRRASALIVVLLCAIALGLLAHSYRFGATNSAETSNLRLQSESPAAHGPPTNELSGNPASMQPTFLAHNIGVVRDWGRYGDADIERAHPLLECYIDLESLTSQRTSQSVTDEVRYKFGLPTNSNSGQSRLGDHAIVGDWVGDGFDCLGMVRQQSGKLLWLLDTNRDSVSEHSFLFGQAGDQPIAGDFDGIGVSDIGVVRAELGRLHWYIHTRSDPYPMDEKTSLEPTHHLIFGTVDPLGSDVPLIGDFNGDGQDDIAAVHRNSGGSWEWLFHEKSQADWPREVLREAGEPLSIDRRIMFGVVAMTEPIVGDWDGDSVMDIGLFRRSSLSPPTGDTRPVPEHLNTWHLSTKRLATADITLEFGFQIDQPIVGRFNRPPQIAFRGDLARSAPLDDASKHSLGWKVTDRDNNLASVSVQLKRDSDRIQTSELADDEFTLPPGSRGTHTVLVTATELSLASIEQRLIFEIHDDDVKPPEVEFVNAVDQEDSADNFVIVRMTDVSGIWTHGILGKALVHVERNGEAVIHGYFESGARLDLDTLGVGTYALTLTVGDGDLDGGEDSLITTQTVQWVIRDGDTTGPEIRFVNAIDQLESDDNYVELSVTDSSGVSTDGLKNQVWLQVEREGHALQNAYVAREYRIDFNSWGAGSFEISVKAGDADNDRTDDSTISQKATHIKIGPTDR